MRGRKPLSVGMKQTKQDFNRQLKSYSATALKNIISIAENSFDVNVRLKANQYILDRCYGRDYRAVVQEQKEQNIQEKNSQLAKTYLNGFGLRNIQAQMSNKLTALEKDGEN